MNNQLNLDYDDDQDPFGLKEELKELPKSAPVLAQGVDLAAIESELREEIRRLKESSMYMYPLIEYLQIKVLGSCEVYSDWQKFLKEYYRLRSSNKTLRRDWFELELEARVLKSCLQQRKNLIAPKVSMARNRGSHIKEVQHATEVTRLRLALSFLSLVGAEQKWGGTAKNPHKWLNRLLIYADRLAIYETIKLGET